MSKMSELELAFRSLVEGAADPAGWSAKWWDCLPDGAVYRRDDDFAGWAQFDAGHVTYFVDLETDLCYGPVSTGIADLFIGFLIQAQTDSELPTN